MAQKLDLRMTLRFDRSSTGDYGKFIARIVVVTEEGYVEHPSTWGPGSDYADLTITAQCDRRERYSDGGTGHRDWYAIEVGYTDTTVTRRRAETMVKVLRRIDAKLEKLEQEYGRADDLFGTVTRVAQALGITKFTPASYRGYGRPEVHDYAWVDASGLQAVMAGAHAALVDEGRTIPQA